MFELLEKMLREDDQTLRGMEWGFIDPSGADIRKVVHYDYAEAYLKKHEIPIPKSATGVVAKFLGLTGNIRYTTELAQDEINFTIVASVSSAQLRAIRQLSKKRKVVYEIVDEQGDTIEYGTGLPDLIVSLKSEGLLEKIEESSIDFPRESLDSAVWDLEGKIPILRADVKKKILAILERYPDVPLLEIAEEIRIVGSIGTNQFLPTADLDCHIIPKNLEEWDEEKTNKVIRWFNENRDEIDGRIKAHPLEVYIQLNPSQDLMSDGVYDLLKDVWLVGPKIVPMSSDPYNDFSHIADDIRDTVEDADKLFGELKRDVIDFEVITDAMEQMSGEDKDRLVIKLEAKLEELEIDIEALYQKKGEWTAARRGASKPETPEQALKDVELARHWKDVNATFKFVNRYQYLRTINLLKELLGDDEISHSEVSVIKTIMGINGD